jgi:hypothetical protein
VVGGWSAVVGVGGRRSAASGGGGGRRRWSAAAVGGGRRRSVAGLVVKRFVGEWGIPSTGYEGAVHSSHSGVLCW